MSRLFVAVWPLEEVVEELCALRRKDQRGVRFVRPDRWHVTLRFLGEADAGAVADALDRAPLAPTEAVLGPAVDVLADRALVVPVAGLDELAATVTEATRHLGDPPPRRRFVGHLTLARLKPYAHLPTTLGAPVSTSFPVDEIALVQSRLDPAGARYETLHTWPTR
ncbi:MAG: RNA 2',3'-cyclic phosphodiesterase [Ilumatobacteraceae bacterium]